jgi:hypothetical protein
MMTLSFRAIAINRLYRRLQAKSWQQGAADRNSFA